MTIQEQIEELETKRVSEYDCPCMSGFFHDCDEWAKEQNEKIDFDIRLLKGLLDLDLHASTPQ